MNELLQDHDQEEMSVRDFSAILHQRYRDGSILETTEGLVPQYQCNRDRSFTMDLRGFIEYVSWCASVA